MTSGELWCQDRWSSSLDHVLIPRGSRPRRGGRGHSIGHKTQGGQGHKIWRQPGIAAPTPPEGPAQSASQNTHRNISRMEATLRNSSEAFREISFIVAAWLKGTHFLSRHRRQSWSRSNRTLETKKGKFRLTLQTLVAGRETGKVRRYCPQSGAGSTCPRKEVEGNRGGQEENRGGTTGSGPGTGRLGANRSSKDLPCIEGRGIESLYRG